MSKTRQGQQTLNDTLSEEIISKICKQQSSMIAKQMDERFNQLDASMKAYMEQVAVHSKKIDNLEHKMEESERCFKLNNLLLYGIQEPSEDQHENVEDKVIQVIKSKLKVNITSNDIEKCFRLGKFQSGKSRAILIRFLSYKNRASIFSKKKLLKNSGFTLREDLSHSAMQQVRRAMEKYGKNNVWSLDGRVYAMVNNEKMLLRAGE